MQVIRTAVTFFLFIFGFHGGAQTITSVVMDASTNSPIPYATVQLNKRGVITNEEGRFSLQLDQGFKETDSLFISCIGYETVGKPLNRFTESTILMVPKAIELNPVIVSNRQYTGEDLIKEVKNHLQSNYDLGLTKKRLFFRDSYHQNLSKTDYTFKESTIDALNEKFLDSVLHTIPKKSSRYTEILGDFYGDFAKDNQKLTLIKASELYDKQEEVDLSALEEKFNEILRKNVKPDSYFKIKSGWFGTKVDAPDLLGEETDSEDAEALAKELEAKKKKEEDRKKNFAASKKKSLADIMNGLFFLEESKLNFINKSNRYQFTIVDFTYMGDQPIYLVDFEPKRSEDYKGRLYINADDFAVVRVDYHNVKSLKTFKLLGISLDQFLSKGKMIFSKNEEGRYQLQFLESESGAQIGIRRPLKIIELNKKVKGRNKQNELSLEIDMASTVTNKQQIVIFNTEGIGQQDFGAIEGHNKVLPTYMPSYDPEFWKGYNIMEPDQAIKEFTSKE